MSATTFPYPARIAGDWIDDETKSYPAVVLRHLQYGAVCLVTRETLEAIAADQAAIEADAGTALRWAGDECQWIDLTGSYSDVPGSVIQRMLPLPDGPHAGLYPAPDWCWTADEVAP
jgi:hypothetical protein